MSRAFSRTYAALLMSGYEPRAASRILFTARLGDAVSLLQCRAAAQLQRPGQRIAHLISSLAVLNDDLRQFNDEGL